ncbi:diflavin oxidoreductase [Arthrobacter bambusae]|uniref:diflavin oxidoreductase n=1 Tax=Arthrobacter bambusae TaxID=1338426 RepID=UPI00278A8B4D|nr:sulfite reductase flavoprotein subunit alpha [Arthrobacter bambusae]MDQ0212185.1 sulfite reductase (NADPH) flavoprotein alpha-component [Arthrobacter bambusae]MDQ0236596.1 sulfite reductase (NADPH) flavoprotein alpha-component [Arthrobacter bambusae]
MTTDTGELVRTNQGTSSEVSSGTNTAVQTLSVLYGSQTGNAEFLASKIVDKANGQGYSAELMSLDMVTPQDAARKDRLLIVTATHDNGHMPDNAQPFWEQLQSAGSDLFKDVPFAVLAIGDSMYEDFCKAGIDLDERLGELGGKRILDRLDCDVDYDLTSGKWIKGMLETFKTVVPKKRDNNPEGSTVPGANPAEQPKSTRREPDTATVVEARLLSAPESEKEVWHYELEVSGDSRNYRAGDSLAVIPANSTELVEDLLAFLNLRGSEVFGDDGKTVRETLQNDYELRLPHLGIVAWLVEDLAPDHPVRSLVESGDRNALEDWLWGRDMLDVLQETRTTDIDPQEFLSMLRPLQHRSYSIASSPLADGDRIHLTVSSVRYEIAGRRHSGACSGFLQSAACTNTAIKVFPLPAHEFHLPNDNSADVIMIGPGVGVAPFRAFLRDREVSQARGRNWLFFGDRHEKPSWLYQAEMEELQSNGVLDRLSLAFSRDQQGKLYVQDRIREEGEVIFAWLSGGASVYVCGGKQIAPDIDDALLTVLSSHGAMTPEKANDYLQSMKSEGRYVKDVY